ncbi:hypothetical protein Y1Q_0005793 [Alligator mississippiensis]|uniref:Uncharacterized protein n=1 Tax=Alligator mississippiensis TaxID=8496 RepID=A0A151MFW7_ALLMI|nr:hypothetical protein Y1Q_0005793 [Alligator mississippiensis]
MMRELDNCRVKWNRSPVSVCAGSKRKNIPSRNLKIAEQDYWLPAPTCFRETADISQHHEEGTSAKPSSRRRRTQGMQVLPGMLQGPQAILTKKSLETEPNEEKEGNSECQQT